MSSQVDGDGDGDGDESGTVKVTLRFWRNCGPEGHRGGAFRTAGDYLPDGKVWPTGVVYVPTQKHTKGKTIKRHVNDPLEWMEVIRKALEDAGVTMMPPAYSESAK